MMLCNISQTVSTDYINHLFITRSGMCSETNDIIPIVRKSSLVQTSAWCPTAPFGPDRWRDVMHKHDDVIKWKHFPRYWPFVREFTGDR